MLVITLHPGRGRLITKILQCFALI